MKYLLDTHTFIWLDSAPSQLSAAASSIVQNNDHTLYLSLTSVWEMQIKSHLGKMKLRMKLVGIVHEQQEINDIQILSITLPHILTLDELPHHHRDPFDRLLVSQAKVEGIPIISKDSQITHYSVSVI